MHLETMRLILREFTADDWPAVYAYCSDPVVVHYLPFEANTEVQTRDHPAWCIAAAQEQPRRVYQLAVTTKADPQVVGTVTLALDPNEQRQAVFSYHFHLGLCH